MNDITLIKGDLLTSTADYICHCVNCQGAFGSGLAGGNQDIITTIIDTSLKNCDNNGLITLEYYYL